MARRGWRRHGRLRRRNRSCRVEENPCPLPRSWPARASSASAGPISPSGPIGRPSRAGRRRCATPASALPPRFNGRPGPWHPSATTRRKEERPRWGAGRAPRAAARRGRLRRVRHRQRRHRHVPAQHRPRRHHLPRRAGPPRAGRPRNDALHRQSAPSTGLRTAARLATLTGQRCCCRGDPARPVGAGNCAHVTPPADTRGVAHRAGRVVVRRGSRWFSGGGVVGGERPGQVLGAAGGCCNGVRIGAAQPRRRAG